MDLSNLTPVVTIEVPEDAVKAIIKEAFKDQLPGFEVKDMHFTVTVDRDMRGETCGTKFGGVKINFKKASSPTNVLQ